MGTNQHWSQQCRRGYRCVMISYLIIGLILLVIFIVAAGLSASRRSCLGQPSGLSCVFALDEAMSPSSALIPEAGISVELHMGRGGANDGVVGSMPGLLKIGKSS